MENHYFIDLFCGAGGVSTGVKMAVTIKVKVIACVNHDPNAILSHEANHPDVKHYTEDILLLDLAELLQIEKAQSIEEPARTLTKNPKNEFTTVQYLLNPQCDSKGASLDQPCFTLIARMDKMPPYLVSCEKGNPYIVIYPSDSETMVKIKFFMAQHDIVDIKMRMAKINELKRITGLPTGYVLIGTETEQKSFIGNAVPTYVVKAMVEAYN